MGTFNEKALGRDGLTYLWGKLKAKLALKADASSVPTKFSQLTNDTLNNVDNVKQYSASNPPPYPVNSVNGKTGAVTINIPSTAADVGLGNVDNVKQYSASNPPPYPITSVNGKTGAVSLGASDVNADPEGTALAAVSSHDSSSEAHADIRQLIADLTERIETLQTALDGKQDKIYTCGDLAGVGTVVNVAEEGA